MAAAVLLAGWGGGQRGRACLWIQGGGLKQPGAALGTSEVELRGLAISVSGWTETTPVQAPISQGNWSFGGTGLSQCRE